MPLDLVRMRALVRKPIGMTDLSDTDMLDSDVDEYLNRAFWEVQDKFPFREKEKAGVFQTVAGQRNYQMPSGMEYLAHLAYVDPISGQHTPIDLSTYDEYEFLYTDDNVTAAAQGPPQKYFREACFVRLWPTPDKIYNIWMRRKVILADLSASNLTVPIPQVWDEILVYGAVSRAFFDFGDVTRGKEYLNLQTSKLDTIKPTDEKELMNSPRAGLEVMGRTYHQEDEPQFSNRRNWNWWRNF